MIRIMNQKLMFSCFSFIIFKPLSSKRLLMNGIRNFGIVNFLMIVTVGQVLMINEYNCQDCEVKRQSKNNYTLIVIMPPPPLPYRHRTLGLDL